MSDGKGERGREGEVGRAELYEVERGITSLVMPPSLTC